MKATHAQRENRAMFRLRREPEGLRSTQLYSVGVTNAVIDALANAGIIARSTDWLTRPAGEIVVRDRWHLTPGGVRELDARLSSSRYSTVG